MKNLLFLTQEFPGKNTTSTLALHARITARSLNRGNYTKAWSDQTSSYLGHISLPSSTDARMICMHSMTHQHQRFATWTAQPYHTRSSYKRVHIGTRTCTYVGVIHLVMLCMHKMGGPW